MNSVRPITVADWQKEWQRIESIIRSMELSLPDYDAHRKEIEDRLDRGEYVEHHSKGRNSFSNICLLIIR